MKHTGLKHSFICVVFLAVLAALLLLLSYVYRPRDNTNQGGMDYMMAHGYLGEPADSIDVFFVGSSELYAGISPMKMWEENGITSYDVATGAQRIYHTDTYVEQILETHHPKLLVVDGYVALKPGDPGDSVFEEAARRFPVFDWHENWKKFDWEMLAAPVRYTNREINKGYRPDSRTSEASYDGFMDSSDEKYFFSPVNRLYLDHIRNMCEAHQVAFALIALPSPENWDMAHHNTLQAYAQQTGIPFWDLNLMVDELDIDPETDYRDGGDHLNLEGANKVSAYLAYFLAEEYGLEDHRDDTAYDCWDEDLAAYPEW